MANSDNKFANATITEAQNIDASTHTHVSNVTNVTNVFHFVSNPSNDDERSKTPRSRREESGTSVRERDVELGPSVAP